jgi:hypothetical protein
MPAGETVHGTCVAVGEAGILIVGASGSGKSGLAREILVEAGLMGRFARLVADDRVRLAARGGRVLARAVASTAGLLEIRGLGIVAVPTEPAAVVRLVAECRSDGARYPEPIDRETVVCGVTLPRIACDPGSAVGRIILWRGLDGVLRDVKASQARFRDIKMTEL